MKFFKYHDRGFKNKYLLEYFKSWDKNNFVRKQINKYVVFLEVTFYKS